MSQRRALRPGIRILFRASAHNMLPQRRAEMATERGQDAEATQRSLDATAALAKRVYLVRTANLPAVPRVGDDVLLEPYPEGLRVSSVTWQVDPEDDDPHVVVELEEMDLDAVAEEDDVMEAYADAGWEQDPLVS